MKSLRTTKAFTLLEMLLVVAIIAILAGIVIVAINPGRQLAQARNAQRQNDLRAIHSAVNQYYIDNFGWPGALGQTFVLTEICDEVGEPTGCLDLSALIPTYISAIPRDPQALSGTGYQIALNSNQTPALTAPRSVDDFSLVAVQIGTSTLVLGEGGGDGNGGPGGPSGVIATCTGCTTDDTSVPGYIFHVFTGNGTLEVTNEGEVEVLVVAGGGGASARHGSAGGAGGVVHHDSYLASGTINVVVGNGGSAGTMTAKGNNGQDSIFGDITAIGGGAGGAHASNMDIKSGNSGGSGGSGAAWGSPDGLGGLSIQTNSGGGIGYGNDGIAMTGCINYPRSVGAGGAGSGPNCGNGGAGIEFPQFAAVGGSPAGWFAGGGSGCPNVPDAQCDGSPNNPGGIGGGGAGSASGGASSNGVQHTGGGGGARYLSGTAGNGGSGIVIVRYQQ